MNSDLDILRELIKDEALVTTKEGWNGKNFLELKERGGRNTSEYKIKIRNIPEDTIAIKSDMFPPPRNVFRGNRGECKRADFVIIARDGERNWIIYIEMKRGRHGQVEHIRQQLQGSRCFVDYCRIVARTFWGKPGFLKKGDYQQRYISVKNIGMNIRPSRKTRKPALHDCPENMLKISAPRSKGIWFKELVGAAN